MARLPLSNSPGRMALGNVIAGDPARMAPESEIDYRPGSGAQVAAARGPSNSV